MSKKEEQPDRLKQFISWVDGDREPKDRTLFVMEQRPHREFRPSEEEFERREKDRLRKFFNWYPIAAAVICVALGIILFTTVMNMPGFGQEDNPINNEVAERYLEHSEEETGSENVVTAMIIGYRGFDTLGESCVLFLAVSAVMILLLRDRKNTSEHELQQMEREETAVQGRSDLILKQVAWVLLPFIFLFAIYVLLNGETSPGGGFSGGTILGAGLILFSAAFGPGHTRVLMNQRRYSAVRTFGLLLYAVLYGVYIFIGGQRPAQLPHRDDPADRPGGGAGGGLHRIWILRPVFQGRDLRGGGEENAGGDHPEPLRGHCRHPVWHRLHKSDAAAESAAQGDRIQHHGLGRLPAAGLAGVY